MWIPRTSPPYLSLLPGFSRLLLRGLHHLRGGGDRHRWIATDLDGCAIAALASSLAEVLLKASDLDIPILGLKKRKTG